MKILETVIEVRVRKGVNLYGMQFGLSPGKGTTDAVFIVRQMQEKFLGYEDMQRLERADKVMVRWTCGMTLRDRKQCGELT
jgi:hypothetical protein